ncbi:MAG TPA: NUDIX hydrolase [Vicinamibacterales bacterium]|nr:NUDIX hydrolase [Vicinamibacterales bacterium]
MPIVFRSRVFSVEVEKKRFPNGRELEVAIVRHPPAVVIIPIESDGRVVLIKQFRPAIDRELWEVPAGSVDEGESPEVAAKRECEEEIGRVPGRIERLGVWFPTPGYCDEAMIFFRATDLRAPLPDSPHHRDEDEDISVQLFTVDEALAMVGRGDIVDLKTAYALRLIETRPPQP